MSRHASPEQAPLVFTNPDKVLGYFRAALRDDVIAELRREGLVPARQPTLHERYTDLSPTGAVIAGAMGAVLAVMAPSPSSSGR